MQAPPQKSEAPRLSRLDERWGLASGYSYVLGSNAIVVLGLPDGGQQEFVDFTSVYGSVNFGHSNPDIGRCLQKGSDLPGICYPPEAEQLARWLCRNFGSRPNDQVLFQVGGSFAVSTALAIARRARPGKVMAVSGGFHGLGLDSQSITSIQISSTLQRTSWIKALSEDVMIVEPGTVMTDWSGISCVIYEPVQGANGYIPLPANWLLEVEQAAQEAGVITIADQIQASFYRHGVLNKARALGLSPDISLCGKSLTNGIYPLSAVIYPVELEPSEGQPYLAHTFQTGTLGYEAGAAVATYIDGTPLEEMACDIEEALRRFANSHLGGDGNGSGQYQTHISGPTLSFQPTQPARDVVGAAFAHGLLICSGGPSFERVRVAPPLTIGREQLTHGLTLLAEVLERSHTDDERVPA